MLRLIQTSVYGGPNLYTLGRATRLRLDLGDLTEATLLGLGALETLDSSLPGLADRLGERFQTLTLAQAIAEIALQLQMNAGCRVRSIAISGFHAGATECVYAYDTVEIGQEAGRLAREWARRLAGTEDQDEFLDFAVERRAFARFVRQRAPGPSTVALIEAAEARDIPWVRIDDGLLQLGWGCHQQRLAATTTTLTPHIAVNIATDRALWHRLLGDLGLPVVKMRAAATLEAALAAAERLGYPVTLRLDGETEAALADAGEVEASHALLSPDGETVLVEACPAGEEHRLLVVGGTLLGATRYPDDPAAEAEDVLDLVHPDNRAMAERAVRALGLDLAGLVIRTQTLAESWRATGAAITAIDPQPSLRAAPEAAAAKVMDMLFPSGTPSRIPVATLTGTNGKTTTARMLAHILKFAGHTVGLTTTDAVYINGVLTVKGDMTGPVAANMVLKDPIVDAAVMETARGGLVRAGLGYDACDVGAVLNVTADHIGMGGIESVEELALVKRIVVEVARDTAVLNADDPLVLRMADHTPAKHICYITRDSGHELVREHIRAGGRAMVLEHGLNGDQIVLYDKGAQLPLIWTHLIPATFEGKALHNVENAMFAAAMAHGLGKSLDDIRNGLRTFDMSFFQAPGRLNVFDGHGFRVILDYGHNPAAVRAMVDTVERMAPKGKRITTIMVAGDRRLEDIDAVARIFAGRFDHYICKQNDDLRGREDGELPGLVRDALIFHGVDPAQISVTPQEEDAVAEALARAAPGDLVLIFAEKAARCWQQIVNFGRAAPVQAV
jgi:UDP-N-acetylmuramyl tripeptide synthase